MIQLINISFLIVSFYSFSKSLSVSSDRLISIWYTLLITMCSLYKPSKYIFHYFFFLLYIYPPTPPPNIFISNPISYGLATHPTQYTHLHDTLYFFFAHGWNAPMLFESWFIQLEKFYQLIYHLLIINPISQFPISAIPKLKETHTFFQRRNTHT